MIFLVCCAVTAQAQQNRSNTLHYKDAWVLGDLRAKAFFGDISGATVSQASSYEDFRLWWILEHIDERLDDLEYVTVQIGDLILSISGGGHYKVYQQLSAPSRSIYVPFLPGYGLDRVGFVNIGGWPFDTLGKVSYGYGGIQNGIYYLLQSETWAAGTYFLGEFTLKPLTASEVVTDSTDDLVTAVNLPIESLGGIYEGF